MARKSKKIGNQFEKVILSTCEQYERMGVAYITKAHEPMVPVRPAGKGSYIAFFSEKSEPDFTGTLAGGGSIVFEAKHTSTTNLPFDRVKDHQLEALQKHRDLGAVSFILISFGLKTFYKVDIDDFRALKKQARKKSLNEKDLSNYRLKLDKGFIDFIGI